MLIDKASAFRFNAVCCAVEIGLSASLVLLILLIDKASAFIFNADCVAVEIGLFKSLVLSILLISEESAFRFNADCVAVEIGLFKSLVLLILLISEASAFRFNADCVAVEIGLFKSLVLSTLDNPTILFVIPFTVPVNEGFKIGAFVPIRAVREVERSLSAWANTLLSSKSVSILGPAPPRSSLICVLTNFVVATCSVLVVLTAVGAVGIPVKFAFSIGAFKSICD